MRFSRIKLTNWKNFQKADVALHNRAFLIGPNASGKSNFLDAFRFLRDLAMPGGGLQRACDQRGGVSKIRCLSGRTPEGVGIAVELIDDDNTHWFYEVAFKQVTRFPSPGAVVVTREIVRRDRESILERPDADDKKDERLLSQTALEQIRANKDFRPIVDHLAAINYLHLVPQMIRDPNGTLRDQNFPEMYGGSFFERIAKTSENTRKARLKKIEEVLKIAVPQLEGLKFERDERGIAHLEATYKNWRPNAGVQNENQFSDGTLRLIGLLWALQEGTGLLLMEEPELHLHKGVVSRLAPFIHKAQQRTKRTTRQVFISTHSVDLLSAEGIGAEELLVFEPSKDGTVVKRGVDIEEIRALMENGLPASEAALPFTESPDLRQLSLFEL